jgi:hypothetical protein
LRRFYHFLLFGFTCPLEIFRAYKPRQLPFDFSFRFTLTRLFGSGRAMSE